MTPSYDFAIIGGGIVGLSVGMSLSEKFPGRRLLVLEKERAWANHQTGNNSGVIHSGIYYKPGSLKATLCREGNRSMVEFCLKHGIEHEVCGKVIVATEPEELPFLKNLHERGLANGLKVEEIGREALKEIEPHVRGLAALRVPSTGIVHYRKVAETFARIVQDRGGDLRLNTKVERIVKNGAECVVETTAGSFHAKFVINCAGLHSDRVAKLAGLKPGMKIVPFRGEYYELKPQKRYLVKHLIYPVPNPNFPFLGVHFTRMIDGSIHAGPNAVLSLKREGYHKSDVNLRDLLDVFTYPAFWKLARRHFQEGAKEVVRSLSKAAFVLSLQRLIPEVQMNDVVPAHAGVRAQALMDDGKLMDDFLILQGEQSLHVCNAPSPAATASIEIGKAIVEKVPR
ncbi:MAG: L-2-hydroxyglutarate oxidase [Candidatus Manganitrophaceae bacterium]|nr:MAG: L-2-hydroxyglutarate oxidase [Candidatus Manganitrophaceae bacterium]